MTMVMDQYQMTSQVVNISTKFALDMYGCVNKLVGARVLGYRHESLGSITSPTQSPKKIKKKNNSCFVKYHQDIWLKTKNTQKLDNTKNANLVINHSIKVGVHMGVYKSINI